jgi:hypothetical protein
MIVPSTSSTPLRNSECIYANYIIEKPTNSNLEVNDIPDTANSTILERFKLKFRIGSSKT